MDSKININCNIYKYIKAEPLQYRYILCYSCSVRSVFSDKILVV